MAERQRKYRGTVKWFSNAKGYGFISPEKGGDDIFAHLSALEEEGAKLLKSGQRVLYDVVQGPNGLLASNIIIEDNHKSSIEPELDKLIYYDFSTPIELIISPGQSSSDNLSELFCELSILYQMVGGASLEFELNGSKEKEGALSNV